MQVTVYREDGIVTDPTEPLPTLLQRDTQAVWVALDRARPADLQLLTDVFHFHPLAVEDSQKTGQRPKIEAYEEHLFITMHAARGARRPAPRAGCGGRRISSSTRSSTPSWTRISRCWTASMTRSIGWRTSSSAVRPAARWGRSFGPSGPCCTPAGTSSRCGTP